MSLAWKKCSSCKKDIMVNSPYYVCSVSSCQSKRTGYVFCSIPCWEVHLPIARHRDASAIEEKAPSQPEPTSNSQQESSTPRRRIIPSTQNRPSPQTASSHEILIVASKLKAYIKDSSGMNTSQGVMSVLSDMVRAQCEQAIDRARAEGRKTVLDRDFKS